MAISIYVYQGEIVVVKGRENLELVEDIWTDGLGPCVGLVLWSRDLLAVGHLDSPDDEQLKDCRPLIETLKKRSPRQGFLIGARGQTGNNVWPSYRARVTLSSMFETEPTILLPAPLGHSAKVKLFKDGNIQTDFEPSKSNQLPRGTGKPPWHIPRHGTDFTFSFLEKKEGAAHFRCHTEADGPLKID